MRQDVITMHEDHPCCYYQCPELGAIHIGVNGKECTRRSGWPGRGVYFFFEDHEFREDGSTLRVVRVGTHAVSANSRTTLWNRLHTHRGASSGGGNHRGSIFRKRVGETLLQVGSYALHADCRFMGHRQQRTEEHAFSRVSA
jgi:hypothetical protein